VSDFPTWKTLTCREYSSDRNNQFSKGNIVQDTEDSNLDGNLLTVSCCLQFYSIGLSFLNDCFVMFEHAVTQAAFLWHHTQFSKENIV
jgi:hypothetical protein